MVTRNPPPESEQQIGLRLRHFRTEKIGLTAAEFARRTGIDSSRLATYERGAVPIRFEFALEACREFNICQRWLAEGSEPVKWFVPISRTVLDIIPKRSLFSSVYRDFLKPTIDGYFLEFEEMHNGKLSPEAIEALQQMVGHRGPKGLSKEEVLRFLHQQNFIILEELPPELFDRFGSAVWKAAHEFKHANAQRIEDWEKVPKVKQPLPWAVSVKNSPLTVDTLKSKTDSVKPLIPSLLEKVKRKASKPGVKADLARLLGVAPARISEWLSGQKEPGGEYTLQLLKWVEQS